MIRDILCILEVDRVLANHSLSSTASQEHFNIPFHSLVSLSFRASDTTARQGKGLHWNPAVVSRLRRRESQ